MATQQVTQEVKEQVIGTLKSANTSKSVGARVASLGRKGLEALRTGEVAVVAIGKEVGHDVKKVSKKAGQEIKEDSKIAGHEIKEVSKKAGHEIKEVSKSARHEAKKVSKKVGREAQVVSKVVAKEAKKVGYEAKKDAGKIIHDLKELPTNAATSKRYAIYFVRFSLLTSLIVPIFYMIRMVNNGRDKENTGKDTTQQEPQTEKHIFSSIVHIVLYVAMTIICGIGLYGISKVKPRFIIIVMLALVLAGIGETICIFVGFVLSKFGYDLLI